MVLKARTRSGQYCSYVSWEEPPLCYACKLILHDDKQTVFIRGNLGKRGVIRAPAWMAKFMEMNENAQNTLSQQQAKQKF